DEEDGSSSNLRQTEVNMVEEELDDITAIYFDK
ncbi:hypothetical protein Tco_1126306, partial [Tanacetum coccineum]